MEFDLTAMMNSNDLHFSHRNIEYAVSDLVFIED